MKFTVGYQLRRGSELIDCIIAEKEHISEVYFSWGDMPNGRNDQLRHSDFLAFEAQARQVADLRRLSEEGVALNLLLNANCYGADSLSRRFFTDLGDTVDCLCSDFGLSSVTLTSPVTAKFIKSNFPALEVRASVNMRIGTEAGMEYISELFDGYYMQREFNRDIGHIRSLRDWCDAHGKKLYGLANSGCLNFCSAQTFHDNLVAHEQEIAKMDNAYDFQGICHMYLKDERHHRALIENTSFIRPEDVGRYEGLFCAMKLATRVSRDPVNIIRSYIGGRYAGNILEILEPSHSIYPYVLENGDPLRIVKIDTDIPIYQEYEEITEEKYVNS